MQTQGFVTISDHRYFPGVRALINSIRANSPADITVIDEGLTPEQRHWLDRQNVEHCRTERSIRVNSERFGCCYALFNADAATYDRMVVIDPDALVLADVSHLFETLDEAPVAAMADRSLKKSWQEQKGRPLSRCMPQRPLGRKMSFLTRHGRVLLRSLDPSFRALNSGVVALRRELLPPLRKAAQRYADFFEDFQLPDQNLMSLCLADMGIAAKLLPFQDNAINLHLADADGVPESERMAARLMDRRTRIEIHERGINLHDRDQPEATTNVRIVHFVGARKPWQPAAPLRAGFRELWESYLHLQEPAVDHSAKAPAVQRIPA